jgi:hypothetical protein
MGELRIVSLSPIVMNYACALDLPKEIKKLDQVLPQL